MRASHIICYGSNIRAVLIGFYGYPVHYKKGITNLCRGFKTEVQKLVYWVQNLLKAAANRQKQ
jgi:hypothetical protein